MEQKYYEIGDKFSLNGETYEVKEEEVGEQCERCAFRNECQDNLQCGSNERKDGKDVYFEKVENMEQVEGKIQSDTTINVEDIKPCTAEESLESTLNTAIRSFEKQTGLSVQTISGSKCLNNTDDPDKINWIITSKLE